LKSSGTFTRPGGRRRITPAGILLRVALGVALILAVLHVTGSHPPTKERTARQPLALGAVKDISYMPSDASWSNMWSDWQPEVIAAGYKQVAGLGANTVRVIIPPDTFGWPTVTPRYAARLRTVLSLAAKSGLHVQLTLFDQWGRYNEIALSKEWVRSLFAGLTNDRQIAFVELQNELDPGYAAEVEWADALLPLTQRLSGRPITISTPGSLGAPALRTLKATVGSKLSFYDYHYYGSAGGAAGALALAVSIASPKALFVGEVGASTYSTGSPGLADSAQYQLYAAVSADTRSLHIADAAPWTLRDLEAAGVPQANVAPSTLRFGIYTTCDQEKPAAVVVKDSFSDIKPPILADPSFEDVFDGIPQGWSESYPQNATLASSSSVAFLGSHSVSLADTAASGREIPAWTTIADVGVLRHDEKLRVTAWARGERATGLTIVVIAWFGGSGSYLGNRVSSRLRTGTSGWTRLGVEASAPAGAAYAQVCLESSANSGKVWFDDVRAAVAS
jgi:hypothetical protein